MNRFISYVVVFVLGVAVSAWTIKHFYGVPASYVPQRVTESGPRVTPAVARPGGNEIADAAARIEKTVVNIDTVGRPQRTGLGGGLPDFFGIPFGGDAQPVVPKGQASGVIISPDGYIITNNHVVADAQTVKVTLFNHKSYDAKVIGMDSKTDLAVIKVAAGNLSYARFGNSNNIRVGDWVIAVGNALGLGSTVTVGVVSATQRGPLEIEGKMLENAIQTDAAINRGNSGGALADINGNLIGINTAIASTSNNGGSIGIGFAIPSLTAKRIADDLITKGKVVRPWLGIKYSEYNKEIRNLMEQQGLKSPAQDGALVREVIAGSPADQAGIQPYDVILEIDGKKIRNLKTVSDTIGAKKVGDVIRILIWHSGSGQTGKIGVRLTEMPKNVQ